MDRYVCIHGHFYQPPRENAWLEAIEQQDSAYPFHDWNEKIDAECYAPNTAARILDDEGYIAKIVNNYASISFDFGPTLLSWLQKKAPDTYHAIVHADAVSRRRFSGHGSAMAQAYNHMIMPLANSRDKYTQVLWGIRDFERRFNREPEGMWLPETAVDNETLNIMAGLGIRFTVLAPHQAQKVRRIGSDHWEDFRGEIDFSMPYMVRFSDGNSIAVFFYNGPVSREVAFNKVLSDGRKFAAVLTGLFRDREARPQLVHIANDGETYGHHHRFADMALAYAMEHIEANNMARITNYGQYLEKFPPTHEVEIAENTSWSCAHGIERWRGNCGCSTGAQKAFNQNWRKHLRVGLDWLRDELIPRYESGASRFLLDPWRARDDYIAVVLDRSPQTVQKFMDSHAKRSLNHDETAEVMKLLEMQRNAMLMYTSCGWFFDDIARIETLQIIQYAARTIQLAEETCGGDLAPAFLDYLEKAGSNYPRHKNGRQIYQVYIKPSVIGLEQVAAHYAVNSVFTDYGSKSRIYCYSIEQKDIQQYKLGNAKLILGHIDISSQITLYSCSLIFGVLYFGEHNVNAGIRQFEGKTKYDQMAADISRAFKAADYTGVIRLIDRHFGKSTYSLKSLFVDEQRKVLDWIIDSTLSQIETAHRQIYGQHFSPMRFVSEMGITVPKAFKSAAEFILNADLRRELSRDELNLDQLKSILEEIEIWQVDIDTEGISYLLQQTLETLMGRFKSSPHDIDILDKMLKMVEMIESMPFTVDLWQVQNLYHQTAENIMPDLTNRPDTGDDSSFKQRFIDLGHRIKVRVY